MLPLSCLIIKDSGLKKKHVESSPIFQTQDKMIRNELPLSLLDFRNTVVPGYLLIRSGTRDECQNQVLKDEAFSLVGRFCDSEILASLKSP